MVRRETTFGCGDSLSPDIAARLSQRAERFDAMLELECDGKRVRLDSLIGILSVACCRGTRMAVIADGADEQEAAEAICRMLADA